MKRTPYADNSEILMWLAWVTVVVVVVVISLVLASQVRDLKQEAVNRGCAFYNATGRFEWKRVFILKFKQLIPLEREDNDRSSNTGKQFIGDSSTAAEN